MKPIYKIAFTLSILLIAVSASGQINLLEKGKKYSVMKLQLKNNRIVKTRSFKLLNDSTIELNHYLSGEYAQLKVPDVMTISEKKGSYAAAYGVVGAGIGLFSCLISQVNSPYSFGPKFGVSVALGGTVIGALIGTAFGASIPKWNSLEFSNRQTSYSIRISPNYDLSSCGIGINLGFDHSKTKRF